MQIYFVALGCDKNLVDSEIMLGIIYKQGYQLTDDVENADVIIVNTCGFITEANEEGINTILKMAEYKTSGKCKSLIVTGCMVQRYKEEIFKELPEIDAILGVGDFDEIGKIIKKVTENQNNDEKLSLVSNNFRPIDEAHSLDRIISTPSYFAYLKIAEGCDNSCTYCTIPLIRGKYRSRKLENIVLEAKKLAKTGVREIILVAQDTSLYGIDIYGKPLLLQLLKELGEIEELKWIRILYCYPEHLTDEIIQEMASNKKVCHYLDIPIQHSEDNILKKMGRKGSKQGLIEVIGKLRHYMPGIIIRTTIIVGFPGETDTDFSNLLNFINDIKFDKLGVFEYSIEEGTPASKMDGQIDDAVKAKRKEKIMLLQRDISINKNKKYLGKKFRVIIDGKLLKDGEETYCGRSYMDCYDIDGMIYFNSDYELINGEFVDVVITNSLEYDLIGEIINGNESSQ